MNRDQGLYVSLCNAYPLKQEAQIGVCQVPIFPSSAYLDNVKLGVGLRDSAIHT